MTCTSIVVIFTRDSQLLQASWDQLHGVPSRLFFTKGLLVTLMLLAAMRLLRLSELEV